MLPVSVIELLTVTVRMPRVASAQRECDDGQQKSESREAHYNNREWGGINTQNGLTKYRMYVIKNY